MVETNKKPHIQNNFQVIGPAILPDPSTMLIDGKSRALLYTDQKLLIINDECNDNNLAVATAVDVTRDTKSTVELNTKLYN